MQNNRPVCIRFAGITLATILLLLGNPSARAVHYETWIEVKSPHYTVYSNAGEHDGRRVALEFEEIRSLFEQSFPKLRVDFGKPVIVFVLKDENSLKLLMPNYGQNKNEMKLAGFYRPAFDRNFAIVRTDVTGTGSNAYHVIYHEWAHGLFRLNYRGLPLWLDEGLAEYWGGSDIDNKQAIVGVADVRQLRLLQQGPLLPIATLVSIDGSSPLYNTNEHAGIFYAESWALVHYLALSPEVREKNLVNKYLATLQETDDPIEAADEVFGDLKKLQNTLETYARRTAFYQAQIKLHSELSEKEFTARRLSPAEGLLAQASYLQRSGHLPEAIAALHEAEKLDPKTPHLHDELGFYHFQKADFDNSGKEFDLAFADDPSDPMVYLYRSYISLRKTGYKPDTTPQIVSNLEKVISLQPNFAAAHAFLSIAYAQLPDRKGKALNEASRAAELEPGNLAYYIDVGKALLANGNLPDARKVAERAQKSAMWPRDRNMAANFMKSVNYKQNPDVRDSVAAAADLTSTDAPTPEQTQKDGLITETLCGHPPSVMFTLKSGDEQLLLHVKDLAKIEGTGTTNSNDTRACTKWKDRKAKVTFVPTPDGPAAGDVKSIQFE